MRRIAPLSWWKLMGTLLVMAGLLQHPVRSHEVSGALGGADAELVAGSEAIGCIVLALQQDGVRVVRPVRPVERAVDPQLTGTEWLLRFDLAPLSRAATVGPDRPFVHYPTLGLVGIVELRI